MLFQVKYDYNEAAAAYGSWLGGLNALKNRPEQERVARLAIRRFPNAPDLHIYLAYALAATGRKAEADTEAQTALRLSGQNLDYYYYYATAMELAQDDQRAISLATDALQRAPADWSKRQLTQDMLTRLNKKAISGLADAKYGQRSKVTMPPVINAAKGLACDVTLVGWDHKDATNGEGLLSDNLTTIGTFDRIDGQDNHLTLIYKGIETEVNGTIGTSYIDKVAGSQAAYVIRQADNNLRLVVNGNLLDGEFTRIGAPTFSTDGQTWVATYGDKDLGWGSDGVLVSGKKIGVYSSVASVAATDAGQVYFLFSDKGKSYLYRNGQAEEIGKNAMSLNASRDGRHLTWIYNNDDGQKMVQFDGQSVGPFQTVPFHYKSKDANHFVVLATAGGTGGAVNFLGDDDDDDDDDDDLPAAGADAYYVVIADGVSTKVDPAILKPGSNPKLYVSPASAGWALYAKSLFSSALCFNGKSFNQYKGIVENTITLSPDGQHIAFLAEDAQGNGIIVNDDRTYPALPAATMKAANASGKPVIDQIIFSPNSQRLVWVARVGDKAWLVEQGNIVVESPKFVKGTLNFSPDSQHVILMDLYNSKFVLRVDTQGYGMPFNNVLTYLVPSDTGVRFIAFTLENGLRSFQAVEVTIP